MSACPCVTSLDRQNLNFGIAVKGTRGGKSSEPEVVVVIPIYCETCYINLQTLGLKSVTW